MWPSTLSGRLPVAALVGHYPTNKLIGRELIPHRKTFQNGIQTIVLSGIRPSFPGLSRSAGQITHVLLTRSPLEYPASRAFPFDLHVLSTPPAFVLSQDQTLQTKTPTPKGAGRIRIRKIRSQTKDTKTGIQKTSHPTNGKIRGTTKTTNKNHQTHY